MSFYKIKMHTQKGMVKKGFKPLYSFSIYNFQNIVEISKDE